jgi:hypothetical protein
MPRICLRPAGFDARPHRPSSLKRAAQRHFSAAAAHDAVLRECRDALRHRAETLTPLTLQARDLYEHSVVPVREIARLVGVHERTLYRYVQKYRWRRRYNVPGAKPRPKPRRKPSRFSAQPRGAGGRYLGRARMREPVVHGLKALDPQGAAHAAAACARAKAVSDAALTRARALRGLLSRLRTIGYLTEALRHLAAVLADRRRTAAQRDRQARQQRAEREQLDARRRAIYLRLDNLLRDAEPAPAAPPPAPIPAPTPAPTPATTRARTTPRIRLVSD